jgi:hypothetical protein
MVGIWDCVIVRECTSPVHPTVDLAPNAREPIPHLLDASGDNLSQTCNGVTRAELTHSPPGAGRCSNDGRIRRGSRHSQFKGIS